MSDNLSVGSHSFLFFHSLIVSCRTWHICLWWWLQLWHHLVEWRSWITSLSLCLFTIPVEHKSTLGLKLKWIIILFPTNVPINYILRIAGNSIQSQIYIPFIVWGNVFFCQNCKSMLFTYILAWDHWIWIKMGKMTTLLLPRTR